MKNSNWDAVWEQLDDDLLEQAMTYPPRLGAVRLRKTVLLAAALTLLCALGLTACAVNLFGIRDLLMERSGKTYVTIAGYQNSNEYKALLEWEDRCPKGAQRSRTEEIDPRYAQYGAYSYTAKKILGEILETYHLQPYDQWTAVYDGDPQSLYDAVGVEGFLPQSCATFRGTADPDSPGCSVRNGITVFSFSDVTLLPDGTRVGYEFTNSAKGYMPIFMGFHIDPETVTQWSHKTPDGTRVLLCLTENCSIILAELPHSFLSVSCSLYPRESDGFTPLSKEELEAFADLFCYKTIAEIGQ